MKYTQINEIYMKFGNEKVITGFNDTNIVIKYTNPYLGIIIPLALVIMGLNLLVPMKIMKFPEITINILFILLMLLSLFVFLGQSYTLYFKDNTILLKNKLNKKKVLEIARYPRIYMRYKEMDSYDSTNMRSYTSKYYNLCLQQNDVNIVFDIELLGSKKLSILLNNLQMKNREDVTLEQWQSSATVKEKTFSDYFHFLDKQKRITGVKDSNLNLKIMNNKNLKLKLLICFLFTIISFLISYFLGCVINNLDLSNIFLTISAFLMLADLFFIIQIAEKWKSLSLKVSYPTNSTFKINNQIFDYKKNDIMLCIETYTDFKSKDKHNYRLVVLCNGHTYFSIDLNLRQEKQLGDFIYNLIFQEN